VIDIIVKNSDYRRSMSRKSLGHQGDDVLSASRLLAQWGFIDCASHPSSSPGIL
jgi:hypothetical protein